MHVKEWYKRCLMIAAAVVVMWSSHGVCSDDVSISVQVNKNQVSLGKSAILTVTLQGGSGTVSRPQIPAVNGIEYSSSGSSRNYSIVNGAVSSKNTFFYTIVPKKTGKIEIPPITAAINGTKVTSEAVTIHVVKGKKDSLVTRTGAVKEVPAAQSGSSDAETPIVFVSMEADKKRAYVNEQVTLTFKFFRRVRVYDYSRPGFPSLTGLWVEDLPLENPYYQVINNERYVVEEKKIAVFPTTPGEVVIGPATLYCIIPDFSRSRRRDMFSVFDRDPFEIFNTDSFGMFGGKKVMLKTQPFSLQVAGLPVQGKPEGFSGTVGQFAIKASVDRTEIPAGQPIALKIAISGKGNINTVKEPVLEETGAFKVYESGSTVDVSKHRGVLGGKKVFEKVLIPKEKGNYTIPALKFCYFDPASGKYETVKTNHIPVSVTAGNAVESTAVVPEGISKEKIKYLGRDINHIKTNLGRLRKQGTGINKLLLINLLPLCMLVFGLGIFRHKKRLMTDHGLARARRAKRWAEKHFSDAKKALKQDRKQDFYRALSRAITNYIADKRNVPSGGMHRSDIKRELEKAGTVQDVIQVVDGFLEKTEMASFAKSVVEKKAMEGDLKEAMKVLSLLRSLKSSARRSARTKSSIFLLALLLLPAAADAAAPEYVRELFEKGNANYQDSNYAQAADAYNKIIDMGLFNANLYYNLGNCYYRLDNTGKAVYFFRKAEALNKRDGDISENLQIALLRCKDKQPDKNIPIGTYFMYVFQRYLNETERLILLSACIWLFSLILLIMLFAPAGRNVFSKILLVVILVGCLDGMSIWKDWYMKKHMPEAVVMAESSTARSGPGDQYKKSFELHEGTTMRVMKRKYDWAFVKLPNKMEGWVPAGAIEEL